MLLLPISFIMLAVSIVPPAVSAKEELTAQEKEWLEKAYRQDKDGWVFVHIEGEPLERGFQYGYLVPDEYAEILRITKYMTYQTTGMPYEFFAKKGEELTKGKIPKELL